MTSEKTFPSVQDVLQATKETAPEGWAITHEYPDCVGVEHSTFTNDQFIMMGDINEHFAFNDSLDVCGSMEDITDAKEIAISFWNQIGILYPDLIGKEIIK